MRTICPQLYDGWKMLTAPCTRCAGGWSLQLRACVIETGAEDLDIVAPAEVPTCPLQDSCQHQVQAGVQPCAVRARGMICASALESSGLTPSEAADHPLAWSAYPLG